MNFSASRMEGAARRLSRALLFVIELAESLQGTARFLPFAALVKPFEARDGSSVLRLVLQPSGARSIETMGTRSIYTCDLRIRP